VKLLMKALKDEAGFFITADLFDAILVEAGEG
jgi:hypothetical protein